MLEEYKLERILFLDIETVPIEKKFDDLSDATQELWKKKADRLRKEDKTAEELYPRAGIYSEFGKIVCISFGFFRLKNNKRDFRVKSFYGDKEEDILTSFFELLNEDYFKSSNTYLCGHNAKEFDFPYIARRALINGLKLPSILSLAGKKPWEVKHLDTMQLWKFGDYKNYTSLELLANIFNIPTPKDDIDGSQVGQIYWEDGDLKRIAIYCQKDVITTAQVFLKFSGKDILQPEEIQVVDI